MPLDPRAQHTLDQYLAWALDIYQHLHDLHGALLEAGYTGEQAWELILRMEGRLLGPLTEYVADEVRRDA